MCEGWLDYIVQKRKQLFFIVNLYIYCRSYSICRVTECKAYRFFLINMVSFGFYNFFWFLGKYVDFLYWGRGGLCLCFYCFWDWYMFIVVFVVRKLLCLFCFLRLRFWKFFFQILVVRREESICFIERKVEFFIFDIEQG